MFATFTELFATFIEFHIRRQISSCACSCDEANERREARKIRSPADLASYKRS